MKKPGASDRSAASKPAASGKSAASGSSANSEVSGNSANPGVTASGNSAASGNPANSEASGNSANPAASGKSAAPGNSANSGVTAASSNPASANPSGQPAASRAARLSLRSHVAVGMGQLARQASRMLGRGSGGMIGGKVALKLSPNLLKELSRATRTVLVTGTNGKSTTNRMVRAALETLGPVASNINGDNMPPGVTTAFMSSPAARLAAIEVDEMHLPIVAAQTDPQVMILLNLSRDQLDRVGEIGTVERRLRQAVDEHPHATVVANCDDPLIASSAWDGPRVVWVAAGSSWADDSVGFPRGGRVVRSQGTWRVPGSSFERPKPDWWLDDVRLGAHPSATLHGPGGQWPLTVALPGRANLANAAQAVAAAVTLGVSAERAVAAVGTVTQVAGRYSTYDVDGRSVHLMLAKNPAGWQEAMTMINPDVNQVAVVVNGQVPDGQDLSWLWDVDFSRLNTGPARSVVASGERGADLAVRLEYAGIHCAHVAHPMDAIHTFGPGPVEVLANYTSFRDLKRELDRLGGAL